VRLKKKTRDAAYNHIGLVWCGLWCLTPLSTIFSYIVAVSFIGGENRKKPPTCHKSPTNFIT
jgi:hypothetical protein